MVRLLGEVAALPGEHVAKKRFLMDGLCALIGADAWAWSLACQYEIGKPVIYAGFLHGGFTENTFPHYLAAVEHPATVAMTDSLIEEMRTHSAHITRTIEQISGDLFYDYEATPLWKEVGVGTLLISMRPLDERCASGIGVYRNLPAEPFSRRESLIAHIILSEVPWLHEQGWPEDRGVSVPKLSPRQRHVLNLLIDGEDRRGIAERLNISTHTANDYVKAVYRHFHVNSQAALMRRFILGDGGHREQ